jgi:hypothetical protein
MTSIPWRSTSFCWSQPIYTHRLQKILLQKTVKTLDGAPLTHDQPECEEDGAAAGALTRADVAGARLRLLHHQEHQELIVGVRRQLQEEEEALHLGGARVARQPGAPAQ